MDVERDHGDRPGMRRRASVLRVRHVTLVIRGIEVRAVPALRKLHHHDKPCAAAVRDAVGLWGCTAGLAVPIGLHLWAAGLRAASHHAQALGPDLDLPWRDAAVAALVVDLDVRRSMG